MAPPLLGGLLAALLLAVGVDAGAPSFQLLAAPPSSLSPPPTPPALYHGWACPLTGCDTGSFDSATPTANGGTFPHLAGDTAGCAAWKLAATVHDAAAAGVGHGKLGVQPLRRVWWPLRHLLPRRAETGLSDARAC